VLKKLLVLSVPLILIILFTACSKDKSCKPRSVDSETAQMQAFAATNGITATRHSSGLYYEIISSGNGKIPSPNSKIRITYTGKFMNGATFDELTTPNTQAWSLNELIQGWAIGIPLIKEGGRIKLIIPSSLGYGCEQYYTIPGNSVLYFDVTLVEVQ
jgi:FKBP-type peptidyl-prolyl cis-trans isomerase FkpA